MARPSPQTERLVSLIGLLAQPHMPELRLSEATRRLGVNKSTCHSMLQALTAAGWLVQHPARKTYRLGPGLLAAGRTALASTPLAPQAWDRVRKLSESIGQVCQIFGYLGDHCVLLDQVPPKEGRQLGMRLGQQVPLRPSSRAIPYVAWWGDEAVDRWCREQADASPAPTADEVLRRLKAAVATTRRDGFTVLLRRTDVAGATLAAVNEELLQAPRSQYDIVERLLALIAEHDYTAGTLEDTSLYDVSAIAAPIMIDRLPVLSLSVTGFSEPVTGSRLRAMGRRVGDTAALLTPQA